MGPTSRRASGRHRLAVYLPPRYLPPQARFRLAVRLDAAYQPAYANLGLALASQARHLEAAAAHRQALALEPRDSASGVGLGDALRSGGDAAAAARAYRAALALAPAAAGAYTGLAHVLKSSDPAAASAAFEAAARGDDAMQAEAERVREWLRDVPPGRARGAAELEAASRYPALFEGAPRCAEAEMSEAVAQGPDSLSQVTQPSPKGNPLRTLALALAPTPTPDPQPPTPTRASSRAGRQSCEAPPRAGRPAGGTTRCLRRRWAGRPCRCSSCPLRPTPHSTPSMAR